MMVYYFSEQIFCLLYTHVCLVSNCNIHWNKIEGKVNLSYGLYIYVNTTNARNSFPIWYYISGFYLYQ